MKKVLFVATVTVHINSFHIPYLKMFKEKGYEVHVASCGSENIEFCDKHFDLSFKRNPLNIKNYKAYISLKNIIEENKYDIIHCHTPVGGVLTRIAAKKQRKNKTKVVYTAHGFHFYKGAPLLNWLIYYPIEKYLSRYTDCIITINKEDYEIADKRFKKTQVKLIHGVGVEENKFNFKISEKEKLEIKKELNLKEEDFVLIQVGELNKNKNQNMSILAMKEIVQKYPSIHLLLVGTGKLNEYYTKKIKKYKLEENIHMLGYRKDVPKLLKISNALISLSYREGLPTNVIEALISKIPVIATQIRGNQDLIKNGQNGYLISINNIQELKEKIISLYENKEETFNIDSEELVLKNIMKEYEEVYDKLK